MRSSTQGHMQSLQKWKLNSDSARTFQLRDVPLTSKIRAQIGVIFKLQLIYYLLYRGPLQTRCQKRQAITCVINRGQVHPRATLQPINYCTAFRLTCWTITEPDLTQKALFVKLIQISTPPTALLSTGHPFPHPELQLSRLFELLEDQYCCHALHSAERCGDGARFASRGSTTQATKSIFLERLLEPEAVLVLAARCLKVALESRNKQCHI